MHSSLTPTLLVFLLLAMREAARAQLGGENIRGDFGLKSGSQGPPGYYLGNFLYFYNSDEVRLAGGTKISGPNLHLFANAFVLSYVTERKFLGAHWGVNIIPAILNAALDLPRLDVGTSNWGIGDSYIQPVQLGWHFKRADAFAGYTFFAATGRFTAGATDNTGLGISKKSGLKNFQTEFSNQEKSHGAKSYRDAKEAEHPGHLGR